MPRSHVIFSPSDYLIQVVDTNSHSKRQKSAAAPDHWLHQKPTDLDLHCLQRPGKSGISKTRVKQQHSDKFPKDVVLYTLSFRYILWDNMGTYYIDLLT